MHTAPLDTLKAINSAFGWHRHPRNGKIARLPETTRNFINHLLEDGLTYREIIDKLQQTASLPYLLSEVNLSNWYRGGYQDWLKDQLRAQAGLPALKGPAVTLAELSMLLSGPRPSAARLDHPPLTPEKLQLISKNCSHLQPTAVGCS